MRRLFSMAFLTSLCIISTAEAHDDAYLDSHPTPHGGQMRMAGPYHMEVLTDQGHLVVFVTDHAGTPINTAGWHGRAIVLTAKQKNQYDLQPSGTDQMRSQEAVNIDQKPVLVISVTPETGAEEQARYTRLTPLSPP